MILTKNNQVRGVVLPTHLRYTVQTDVKPDGTGICVAPTSGTKRINYQFTRYKLKKGGAADYGRTTFIQFPVLCFE